jgi:ABC-type multidrug transport system fused ATPase/permease subunit
VHIGSSDKKEYALDATTGQNGLTQARYFTEAVGVTGIFTAILVYFGGMSAAAALLSAGAWYLFLLSLDRFLWPVMNLSAFWAQIQSLSYSTAEARIRGGIRQLAD